jgi:protein AFG1
VPAIDLIMKEFEVVDLDSGTDYRKMPRALSNVYFNPLTDEHRAEVDKIFQALTAFDGPVEQNRELVIWGRHLKVPESSDNVAKFTFMDLCGKPLSAADYIEVTKRFGTVFLLDVPKMGLGQKDLARRFITFIDACYESHTKLFVTSEVPIYQVFSDDKVAKQAEEKSAHIRSVMDDLVSSRDSRLKETWLIVRAGYLRSTDWIYLYIYR